MEFEIPLKGNSVRAKKLDKLEIVRTTNHKTKYFIYTINIDEDIGNPENYRAVVDILRKSNANNEIRFVFTCWGGYLDSAILLVNEIQATSAKTSAIIHTAGSAATLVAFACDEIIISDISTVMIHNFSVSQQGKGKELRVKAEFDRKQFEVLCESLYKGILTQSEIEAIQDDTDIWMLGSELKSRMLNLGWTPLKERGYYNADNS